MIFEKLSEATMKRIRHFVLLATAVIVALWGQTAPAVEIETVVIGNAGNAAEPVTGFGSVDYEYRLGIYEVTNDQYAEFLNAVATTSDPNELYHERMTSDRRGGIARIESDGGYSYEIKDNMGNKPVNFVSFWDAARFANWLQNRQPTGEQMAGTTETGAYTLTEKTPDNTSVLRNADAVWFIPNADEWFKGAYHQPFSQGGDSDDYWDYATASNEAPTCATANEVGDIANPGENVVNYMSCANWNNNPGNNVITVGSAGLLSSSYYGTYDQNGNLAEWTDTIYSRENRGAFGGTYFSSPESLLVIPFGTPLANTEIAAGGFRVGQIVPEPSGLLIVMIALIAATFSRRRLNLPTPM